MNMDQPIKHLFRRHLCFLVLLSIVVCSGYSDAQVSADAPNLQCRIQHLTQAIDNIEAQLQRSQRELADLKVQLLLIQASPIEDAARSSSSGGATELADAVASIRESQAIHESQIATLAQSKVETASKYPLKLSGMVLMTGFVNTQRMDTAPTPAVALAGSGATGATMQQTILGLDATGPDLFGANSHADLRIDFAGGAGSPNSSGYSNPLIRLRTAHAEMNWSRTKAYFALDHSMLSPESPTSIAAVSLPPLSWSGNLWSWNSQIGISQDVVPIGTGVLRAQAAVTDLSDPPPLFTQSATGSYIPPSTGELSRLPGAQWRIAYEKAGEDGGTHVGVSGFFAPHKTSASAINYQSWAGAADLRLSLTRFTQITGSAYVGAALGSLGGGAYKNAVARTVAGELYFRALDAKGGWLQWKQRTGQRLEFNEAFGIDNVPARQLRPFAISNPISYYNLARNRTATANVIYSPSAYLLFSLEYRRVASSYVTAPTLSSNVIDIVAGYKF